MRVVGFIELVDFRYSADWCYRFGRFVSVGPVDFVGLVGVGGHIGLCDFDDFSLVG